MFEKRTLVTFYLKSGQTIQLRFKKFTVTHGKDGSIQGWKYEEPSKTFVIPLDNVAAVIFES